MNKLPFLLLIIPTIIFAQAHPLTKQGTHTAGAYVENYISEESGKDMSVLRIGMERGYYLWGPLSIHGHGTLVITRGDRQTINEEGVWSTLTADTFGLGVGANARLDAVQWRKHGFYTEAGIGMFFTSDEFPPEGTWWNFYYILGGGLAISLNAETQLNIGWRFMHSSNWKGIENERNPSFNGSGLYGGVRYIF